MALNDAAHIAVVRRSLETRVPLLGICRGLSVAARALDGGVKAIVHDQALITGVQWHPEYPAVAAEQLTPLLLRLERQAVLNGGGPQSLQG